LLAKDMWGALNLTHANAGFLTYRNVKILKPFHTRQMEGDHFVGAHFVTRLKGACLKKKSRELPEKRQGGVGFFHGKSLLFDP